MRPILVLLLALSSLGMLSGCAGAGAVTGHGGSAPPGASLEPGVPPAPSGMPRVRLDSLPPEAIAVLDRIKQGGPYRYAQDGSVFENREGLLPARPSGHYREYTVETPGEDDRGARRIVAGADGERYWTEDHYASFGWIVE